MLVCFPQTNTLKQGNLQVLTAPLFFWNSASEYHNSPSFVRHNNHSKVLQEVGRKLAGSRQEVGRKSAGSRRKSAGTIFQIGKNALSL
jgi:hypothetical protein